MRKSKITNINKEEMEKGYLAMAKINLEISEECFHLESEGVSLGYEMDTTNTQGKAQ